MYRLTITDRAGGILLRSDCPNVTRARERADEWWASHACRFAHFHLTAQDGSTLDEWERGRMK